MAEPGVESNVFQIPDLVGAVNKQNRQNLLLQQRQDSQTQRTLAAYKKQAGKLMNAHVPVVQGLYDSVINAKDAFAINPTAQNKRKIDEAYSLYVDGSAQGQYVFNQVAKEIDFVRKNPGKIAEPILDFQERIKTISNKSGATIEDIQFLANTPSAYQASVGQTKEIQSPVAFGTKLGQGKIGQRVITEARAGDGTIDQDLAKQLFDEQYQLNFGKETNPNGFANHALYQGAIDGTLDVTITEEGKVMFDPNTPLTNTVEALPPAAIQRLSDGAYDSSFKSFINSLPTSVKVTPKTKEKTKISGKPRRVNISGAQWETDFRNPTIGDPNDPQGGPSRKRESVPLLVVNFESESDNINRVNAMAKDLETDDIYLQRTVQKRGEPVTDEYMFEKFGRKENGEPLWTEATREREQARRDKEGRKRTSYELMTESEFSPLLSELKEEEMTKVAEGLGLTFDELRSYALEPSQRTLSMEEATSVANSIMEP